MKNPLMEKDRIRAIPLTYEVAIQMRDAFLNGAQTVPSAAEEVGVRKGSAYHWISIGRKVRDKKNRTAYEEKCFIVLTGYERRFETMFIISKHTIMRWLRATAKRNPKKFKALHLRYLFKAMEYSDSRISEAELDALIARANNSED